MVETEHLTPEEAYFLLREVNHYLSYLRTITCPNRDQLEELNTATGIKRKLCNLINQWEEEAKGPA